jgi:putative ABC transport system permease protein
MTALGYLLGLGISLSTVFGFGVMPLEARTLVPVAGMVVGNSLRVVVVASTRLIDGILAGRHEIEAMLALGFGRRESVRRVVAEALRLSLRPQIETTRTVGMVFLPGLFTGLILAGVEPLDAAIAQAVLLFLILGSAALTGTVVVTLGVRRFLTSDLLLVLPEGSVD